MYVFIVSAVLIACGSAQAINWLIPQATESRITAFIQSCRLVTEPGFSASGLPAEPDILIEQCTIAVDHPQGDQRQLRRLYKKPPLTPMQALPVIGSLYWPDTFRPAGEPRDTGSLQGGIVLTAIGAFIGFLARRNKSH